MFASGKDYPDAVKLYRRVLADRPDGSVVVLAVGPLRNMANLLRSPPDDVSPLDGRALVAKKVSTAVTPGKPDESLLIRAVRYTNEGPQMPPKDKGGKLADASIHWWNGCGAVRRTRALLSLASAA